jgi:hypothetical protein
MLIHSGTPQGGVLSPDIYNFYVSDFPEVAALTESYADDIQAAESSPDIPTLSTALTDDLSHAAQWASEKNLVIAPEKSCVVLFTPDRRQTQTHPQVLLNNTLIPLNKNPKILGVTFDTFLNFSYHIREIAVRLANRLQILKALAGTSWGQQKETLLITFKCLILSIINYAAPIWFPNASKTSIATLQIIQNAALRIVTGNLKMSSVDHLHAETKVLKVGPHLEMLCSQFLANALQDLHVSHQVVIQPQGPRKMKETLYSRNINFVAKHLSDGKIPPAKYKQVIKSIHCAAVAKAVCDASLNEVLEAWPPTEIDPLEATLPRVTRTTLSQLRSGKYFHLRFYLKKIGRTNDDICPECHVSSHTTAHLFNCPSNVTDLVKMDLWKRTREAAAFLKTLPSFAHLPGVPPLPPNFTM